MVALAVSLTMLAIPVSGCACRQRAGALPALRLETGWVPPLSQSPFWMEIDGRGRTVRCMTAEDIEALRTWLILANGVCR